MDRRKLLKTAGLAVVGTALTPFNRTRQNIIFDYND